MINNPLGLYIVATPIGNLQDISKRAVQVMEDAHVIICENPKHSFKLLNNFIDQNQLERLIQKLPNDYANYLCRLIDN